ncbi:MAG: ThuA domain-containing protein [Hyphomonadaceae bacterium]
MTRTARPEITEFMAEPAILVFSKTAGWRHNEGIAGADLFFAELAAEKNYGLFTTVNSAVFNADDLKRFEVVIFNNVTGNALADDEKAAFKTWMDEGGAWIGLHGSGDSSLEPWDWYQDNLAGTDFIGHIMAPQFQNARLEALAPDHSILDGVATDWEQTDEWYSFSKVPDIPGLILLVGLDETTYSPTNTVVQTWPQDLRMGPDAADHPVIWAACDSALGYKAVYSALGHGFEAYRNPNYQTLLSNAFDWVSGPKDSCD